ncbi:MAG: DsrE family protein [Candidatus Nanopelagicales bacterium]
MTSRNLVIKLTTDDPETTNQAFNVAATALAAGVPVSFWLTSDATRWACPGNAETLELAHAAPLAELCDSVLATGQLTVCTQCAARRGLTAPDFAPGVRIAGAATFVAEVTADGAQALVY